MRAIAAVAALAVLLAGCAVVPIGHAEARARFEVTGYAESDGTTAEQVNASGSALTILGVDGVNLTPDGDGITKVSTSALTLLRQAHRLHKKAELLVGNFSSDAGDFSDALAQRMFSSPANIASVVAALKAEVVKHGWDGVTVDLEGLNGWGADGHRRDDDTGLVSFVDALRTALGTRSISIAVVATTGDYADLGYFLDAIAQTVDHLVLMAYDQHGPTWSKAGPVGGYPWVKSTVKAMMRSAPARKIQLGIAGYGYSWPGDGSDGTAFTDAAARARVKRDGATALWDPTQKEWHATLADGTVLWWSDSRSYRARVALAHSLDLQGVAVWSLGGSDPLRP